MQATHPPLADQQCIQVKLVRAAEQLHGSEPAECISAMCLGLWRKGMRVWMGNVQLCCWTRFAAPGMAAMPPS